MVTVYAIQSGLKGTVYVGMTMDITRRLAEHNAGKTRSTKAGRPWNLIYSENQTDWKSARIREKYLKSGVGKEFLKSLVP